MIKLLAFKEKHKIAEQTFSAFPLTIGIGSTESFNFSKNKPLNKKKKKLSKRLYSCGREMD